MGHSLELVPDTGLIRVATTGDLHAEEFLVMIRETNRLVLASGRTRVLVDHSLATVESIPASGVRTVAKACEILNDAMRGGRMAILVTRDIDYGLARMWKTFADGLLAYDSALFRDYDEAIRWLGFCSTAAGIESVSKPVSDGVQGK